MNDIIHEINICIIIYIDTTKTAKQNVKFIKCLQILKMLVIITQIIFKIVILYIQIIIVLSSSSMSASLKMSPKN